MNPRREMERRARRDSYDRGARAAFLGEPGDLPAGLPRHAALRWMRGYLEATAVCDGTAQRGTRAEKNRAAISIVLPDLSRTRGVEVVAQLAELPAFLRCDCAPGIGEMRADGYVICDECDGIMVVSTLAQLGIAGRAAGRAVMGVIVDNDDVGLPGTYEQDRFRVTDTGRAQLAARQAP